MHHTGQFQFIHEATIFLACAIVFAFTAFAFLITILFGRIINTYRTRRHKKLREEFQKTLNVLIILDHSKENISHFSLAYYLKDLRQKIRTSFGKQLLIDLLIANKQNLTGGSATILRKVYIRLQLKKFSYAKLGHYKLLKKVQGLQELAEMECIDSLPVIQKLFRHKRLIIRQESFIAMVRLAGAAPFVLVDHYFGSVTPWMQLTIHKHLATVPAERLPKFHRWFNNKNKEIQKFAIVMAHQFRQSEAIPHLAVLLKDADLEIAGLAADMLGDMGAFEYVETIVGLGKRHLMNDSISLRVIHALEQIGNGEEHGALLAWQMINGSYAVRFEAMRVMQKLNLNCRDFLIDFNVSNDDAFESIYAHITEPLLQ